MSEAPTKAQLIRMAPEYRRCAIYVLVAEPFFLAAFLWSASLMEDSAERLVVPIAFLAVLGLGALAPLRWALRFGDQGVERRWFNQWELWSWRDFAIGRIAKQGAALVDPQRPWYARKLGLAYLSVQDRNAVLERINAHYRLPPAPTVPGVLRITVGVTRVVELDAAGVHLSRRFRNDRQTCSWSDVQRVHVTRLDPLRRDFACLALELPGERIEFHEGNLPSLVREQLDECLRGNVASERIETDILDGPLVRSSDVQRLLAKETKDRRLLRWFTGTSCALFAVMMLWIATESVWRALAFIAIFGSWLGSIMWFLDREMGRKIDAMEADLAERATGGGDNAPRQ
jgi:hypothetical protein